ncbi:MAG: gamma-glutamylcyclotransferase [Alphaproteobacteria bacterium]|nr:gamma-glutamylcyclotransferase [Alphaproteobacteria bacterium]
MDDLWSVRLRLADVAPGFVFEEAVPACCTARTARFASTPGSIAAQDRPGLVLGLDRGGACRSMAFRGRASARGGDHLSARPRAGNVVVYLEAERRVRLADEARRLVPAVTYLVDRSHEQYAGVLPLERQVDIVRAPSGNRAPIPTTC